jgi:hypothetical protein
LKYRGLPFRIVLYRCFAVVFILTVLVSPAPGADEARLVSTSGAAVSFEITVPPAEIIPTGGGRVRVHVPGYGSFSPPGAIELPGRTFIVAIPPTSQVRVSSTILADEPLGALSLARVHGERFVQGEGGIPVTEFFEPPDPWADIGPPPAVAAGEPCLMGRQRVLPVRVIPLVYGEHGSRLIRKIAITVHFEAPTPESPGMRRDIPISGPWRRLYARFLVNPHDVTRFRKQLAAPRVFRAPFDVEKRLRIEVPETGLFAVRADSLIDAGLAGVYATDNIALRKYYYDEGETDLTRVVDIPILVLESASAAQGQFEGEDLLVFYALGIKDDTDAGDIDARYTDKNTYWLEAGPGVQGVSMEEMPPLPGPPSILARSFSVTTKVRNDTYYHKRTKPHTTDFYFHATMIGYQMTLPFMVHHPAGGSSFDLTVRGQGYFENYQYQRLTFYIGDHYAGVDSLFSFNSKTFTFDDLPSDWLSDGTNQLVIKGTVENGLMVNDFSFTYPGSFAATDNKLEFATGTSIMNQTVEIPGFTDTSGVLIEITDPANPRYRELPSGYFTGDAPPYTLTFNLEPPASGERRFIVTAGNAWNHLSKDSIEEDFPSDLAGEVGPFNTLVVSHGDFIDDITDYVSWRRGQGYRILVAEVQDVFDEFNGGMPNCDAIRRFIDYGVNRWGVEFVLLVGDGNEDHRRIYPQTPVNFIPPFTFSFNVIGVGFDDEVMATDRYYSFIDEPPPIALGGGGSPDPEGGAGVPADDPYLLRAYMFPDVMLGRIPIGEDYEMRALAIKTYDFEESDIDDTWRRRVILWADDAWSGRLNYYRYKYGEEEFARSMGIVGDSIEAALPGGFDIKRINMSVWTDEPHKNPGGDPGAIIYSRTQDSVRTYFTPYLVDRWDDGAQLFSFQGHGNRSTLTTEAGFASFQLFDDLDSLRTPIPNVFTAFGCHISEFARVNELGLTPDGRNGDCITEQLLFKPRSGSVGTYASTGYEFLSDNARLCETLHTVMFTRPPADSVPPGNEYTGARWILGELILTAEMEHILKRSYGFAQVFRYITLGDPMLRLDSGPPLMKLQGDWGGGWVEIAPDSLRARNGTNEVKLRFTASDVIALERITLEIDGEDWTDSLDIEPLNDADKTFARAYRADLDYTICLGDGSMSFRVFKPDSQLVGITEVPITTRIRLFYNDYLEILPTVESPPTGTFRLTVDFPAYLDEAPVLLLDGLRLDEVVFTVPDPQDSLRWEAEFIRTFPSGRRVLTVQVGEHSMDFEFTVSGDDLELEAFNFPNPFAGGTNIVYTLNLPVDAGRIEIFTVSGTKIRTITLPHDMLDAASFLSPHSVYWDGRDLAGDRVANGTYLYVVQVERRGEGLNITGKCVKLE